MIAQQSKQMAVKLLDQACKAGARASLACPVVGISSRTYRRWRLQLQRAGRLYDGRQEAQRPSPSHALSAQEQQAIVQVCNSACYQSLPPSQIVPALAQQGVYMASESSFYRVLRAHDQRHHRGKSHMPRQTARPKAFAAQAPNQLWSWDITYLPSTTAGQYYRLYMIEDIYSRAIVGWEVHTHEAGELAATLLHKTCLKHGVQRQQLVLHADNGSAMKAATMLAKMQTLGVMPSFSRPATSNDNPYSESLFKTLKYTPKYPSKPFASVEAARTWVLQFVSWYNHEHLHSGIGFVTPWSRHTGQDEEILVQRKMVYEEAKAARPDRWKGRQTRNCEHQKTVWLNPEKEQETHVNLTNAA